MGYVDKGREPGLIVAGLASLYEGIGIISYPLVRVTAGAFLLTHGIPKLMTGAVALSPGLSRYGFEPALFWAYFLIFLETIGAICIILGLFTRPIAACLVAQFAIIVFMAHWPRGFSARNNGWEFPAMWGLLFVAILLRGGGPYSLDRKLGREF
jgi:putative oxidoreductase